MGETDGDAMSCASGTSGTSKKGSLRKTREELNDIEKQRTKRINQHIVALRNLLEMSNIVTKKDKFSVLKNTYDYIVKLRQDIGKLNRRQVSEPTSQPLHKANSVEDGICYESLFADSHAPMALASVDGQFLTCNEKFEQLCGHSSHDISKVSIFNLTVPEEMNQLFSVIGSMLSSSDQTARHFWKTCKFKDKVETCFVSIWLVRRKDEDPSCFQMIMVPMSECDGNLSSTNPMKQVVRPSNDKGHRDDDVIGPPGGSMGAGGMSGIGGGIRGSDHITDTLAENLTEIAGSLANVQYTGEDDTWSPDDDMYADIFNSMTEDMNEDDLEDCGSDNSLEMP